MGIEIDPSKVVMDEPHIDPSQVVMDSPSQQPAAPAAGSEIPKINLAMTADDFNALPKKTQEELTKFRREQHPELEAMASPMPGQPVAAQAIGGGIFGRGGIGSPDALMELGSKAVGGIANAVTGLFGTATGKGAEAIKEVYQRALRGDDSAVKAMRGSVPSSDVVGQAKDALVAVKDAKGAAYRSQLEKIQEDKRALNLAPLYDKVEEALKNYNIKRTDAGYDFSRSTLASDEQNVSAMLDTLDEWGSKKGDRTPIMLDTLKRRLDDFYSPSKESRALVTSLRNTVKGILVKEVPEYEKMTSDYAKSSSDIKEIEQALSLGGKAGIDTALGKLSKAIKSDDSYKAEVLNKMEELSGKDIKGTLAGLELSDYKPRMGAIYTDIVAASFLHDPKVLAFLAGSSPRAVGEFFNGLGVSAKLANNIIEKVPFSQYAGSELSGEAFKKGAAIAVSPHAEKVAVKEANKAVEKVKERNAVND